MSDCQLIPVELPEQWQAYHELRRRILWENRGLSDYDESHPDDRAPENHPMLFLLNGEPIGVVRIDLDRTKAQAFMRRVAIAESEQGKGYGGELVVQVERFAMKRGARKMIIASAEDAVEFYRKCGYSSDPSDPLGMEKALVTE